MNVHEPMARSRLVCLRAGVEITQFVRLAQAAGIHRPVPIPLMGGVHCLCDERGEGWLAGHPDVEQVEVDIPLSLTGIWARYQRRQVQEILPEGLRLIRAPQAWAVSQGEGVGVAVIDSGIDLQHPNLAPNLAGGVNLMRPAAPPQDDVGHGTMVAGIAAATRNHRWMAGVAPKARLYAVKVIGADGESALSDILYALQWVVDQGIPIANMSLGTPTYSLAFDRTVQGAVARGLTLVAAAGNQGRGSLDYPAAFAGVIAVTALGADGRLTPFSNSGPEVTVAAPGVNVFSTWRGGGFARASGTSFATPHVTGLAALLLQVHPEAGPDQVRKHLLASAVPLQGQPQAACAGRIDAWNAVHMP